MLRKSLVGVVVMLGCALAHADGSDWRFYAGVGMSDGGDTLFSGTLVNSQTNSSQPFEIKAGTATEFRAGVDYRILDRVTVQASIGHSDDAPMGTNASLDFTKTPVELLGFVNITDAWRFGGGLRKAHAVMSGTGIVDGWEGIGDYSSSRGSVVETQYLFGTSEGAYSAQHNLFGISLRYVNESFTRDSVTFKGNHFELGGAYYY